MKVSNEIINICPEIKKWRHELHAHPELGYEEEWTSNFVAKKLESFGLEIHRGMAKTGVVGVLKGANASLGGGGNKAIGLRADMDALPMTEENDFSYKSKFDGRMHACGHDGHMTMLLGAAKYLNETKNFSGKVALIFQPSEEDGGGGRVMCEEGIMDTFSINQVYGLHNAPGLPLGFFKTNPGPNMAAADDFTIEIKGKGGHGANPEETFDPIIASLQVAQSIQTISSRNLSALDNVVISITQIHSGTTHNIIPEKAFINGTVRTLDKVTQRLIKERLNSICEGIAISFNCEIKLKYNIGYPVTFNHKNETKFSVEVATEISGSTMVDGNAPPIMGSEDFSYMLLERPGAYLHLGQGDGPALHSSEYDFNDELSPIGASFFVKLVEKAQPL